jgi:serine/threonine protein kinase/tetratricopeptide (TPR) repeat protein
MNIDLPQDATAPSPPRLEADMHAPGSVLAGRFTLEELAGRGGMGSVYRARDSQTGQNVALKLLHPVEHAEALQRFSREAELLAELRHPGIVSHVAHGLLGSGQPFLAMEWLEGEDLSRRLARQPLSLPETLSLMRRVAEALATAHRHGIIHRDLKPSNLFLRHGRPDDVVMLDFGLARRTLPSQALTGSHVVLGTPGYMAPEQASGEGEVLPSADIFSLGCVLYECLTAQPPFSAPHFAAVLAKILFAPPTPLRTLRAELPESLQALVDRMLAKDPHQRVPDATHLLPLLPPPDSMPDLDGLGPTRVARRDSPMQATQQLVTILLAAPPARVQLEPAELEPRRSLRDSLRAVLTAHRAQVELMADGSLVATLMAGRGTPTDQAALAARCALSVKERWPELTVVLVTGRGVLSEHLPVGEAMDRAGQLLHHFGQPAASPHVVLDEVTAGLLGAGFQLDRASTDTFLLHGEHLSADASRPLLGRPTACVGREQELALLELAFTTCVEDSDAQALLVVAAAGMGKSRLRHEFLRRVARRGLPVRVLQGRADPMGVGCSVGLLGQALQRLCELKEGEPLEERRRKVAQRLGAHLPERETTEVVALLGELCGVAFPDEGLPRLREARGDPALKSVLVGQALVTWLRAETQQGPVLLVLEDLHWGDALTVQWVDKVLRELPDSPLLVLALARPEVKELFPGLWSQRVQEVSLRGLSRKAGAQLIREVLGPNVAEPLLERLLEQSAGNALFLEELIRMAAEGRAEAPPGTVLAMLQARILRLESEARLALLSGSFLGRTFWTGAVRALRGQEDTPGALEHALERLVELEFLEHPTEHTLPAEKAYRFRHALMREAAYALVPEGNKAAGHRVAGEWLERVGEGDKRVLAEHAWLGGQPERAFAYHLQAAEQLAERGNVVGALQCVETALGRGPQGEQRSRLRALRATLAFWMNDQQTLVEMGTAVLPELKPGTPLWSTLLCTLIINAFTSGRLDEGRALTATLLGSDPEPDPEALRSYCEALCYVSTVFIRGGRRQPADACIERARTLKGDDPSLQAYRDYAEGFLLFHMEPKPWQAMNHFKRSAEVFQALGRVHSLSKVRTAWGLMAAMLGDMPGAVALSQESLALALRLEQPMTMLHTQSFRSLVLACSPDPAHREQARALARASLGTKEHHALYLGLSHMALAIMALEQGQPLEAEPHARKAYELLPPLPGGAGALLSTALRVQGRVAEARALAEEAVRHIEDANAMGLSSLGAFLALAEACFASEDRAAGQEALRKAVALLHACAEDLPEPALRERLYQVPDNARLLQLARQHL